MRSKKEASSISESFDKLGSELEELKNKLRERDEFAPGTEELQNQNAGLKRQVELLSQEITKINRLNDELRKKLTDFEKKEDKSDILVNKNVELNTETIQLKAKIDELMNKNSSLESYFGKQKNSNEALSSSLEEARAEMERLESELIKTDKMNDSISRKLFEKDRAIQAIKENENMLSQRVGAEVTRANSCMDQVHILENELLKFDRMNSELKNFNVKKNIQLKQLGNDADLLKSNLSDKLNQLVIFNDEIIKRESLIGKLNDEVNSLKKKVIEKDQQIIHLNSDLGLFKEKSEKKDYESEIESLRDNLTVFDKENKYLIQEMDNLNLTVSELKEMLKKKNKEMFDKQTMFMDSMARARKDFDKRVQELNRENVELEIAYKARIAEMLDRIDDLQRTINEKEKKEKEIIKKLNAEFKELVYLENEDISTK
jgi:chromosome segregation ATPase